MYSDTLSAVLTSNTDDCICLLFRGEVFCFFDPISFGNENYVDLGGIFFRSRNKPMLKGYSKIYTYPKLKENWRWSLVLNFWDLLTFKKTGVVENIRFYFTKIFFCKGSFKFAIGCLWVTFLLKGYT